MKNQEPVDRVQIMEQINNLYHHGSDDNLVLSLYHIIDDIKEIIASAPIITDPYER